MSSIKAGKKRDRCGIREQGGGLFFMTIADNTRRKKETSNVRKRRVSGVVVSSRQQLVQPCDPVRGRQGDLGVLVRKMVCLAASGDPARQSSSRHPLWGGERPHPQYREMTSRVSERRGRGWDQHLRRQGPESIVSMAVLGVTSCLQPRCERASPVHQSSKLGWDVKVLPAMSHVHPCQRRAWRRNPSRGRSSWC